MCNDRPICIWVNYDVIFLPQPKLLQVFYPEKLRRSLEKSSVNIQRNSSFGDGESLRIQDIQEDVDELSRLKNSRTGLLTASMCKSGCSPTKAARVTDSAWSVHELR